MLFVWCDVVDTALFGGLSLSSVALASELRRYAQKTSKYNQIIGADAAKAEQLHDAMEKLHSDLETHSGSDAAKAEIENIKNESSKTLSDIKQPVLIEHIGKALGIAAVATGVIVGIDYLRQMMVRDRKPGREKRS